MSWKDPDIRKSLSRNVRLQCAGEELLTLVREMLEGKADGFFARMTWLSRAEALLSLVDPPDHPDRETSRIPQREPEVKALPGEPLCLDCGHGEHLHYGSRFSGGCILFAPGPEGAKCDCRGFIGGGREALVGPDERQGESLKDA